MAAGIYANDRAQAVGAAAGGRVAAAGYAEDRLFRARGGHVRGYFRRRGQGAAMACRAFFRRGFSGGRGAGVGDGLVLYGMVCACAAVYLFFERAFMTQILVLLTALAGVVIRIRQRKTTPREWWLLGFAAVNIFLVQLQMFVGENGKLVWILRYHQAALTFLYGWAAWTAVSLIRALNGGWKRCAICAVCLWFAGAGGSSLWRIVKHEFTESSRNARTRAAEWAAEIIAKDWKGPRVDSERFFTVQEYHPRLRPIVHSVGAQLPYLIGGRWYSLAQDVRRHEKPDYALLPESEKAPRGMKLIAKKSFGRKKRTFLLYRSGGTGYDKIRKR